MCGDLSASEKLVFPAYLTPEELPLSAFPTMSAANKTAIVVKSTTTKTGNAVKGALTSSVATKTGNVVKGVINSPVTKFAGALVAEAVGLAVGVPGMSSAASDVIEGIGVITNSLKRTQSLPEKADQIQEVTQEKKSASKRLTRISAVYCSKLTAVCNIARLNKPTTSGPAAVHSCVICHRVSAANCSNTTTDSNVAVRSRWYPCYGEWYCTTRRSPTPADTTTTACGPNGTRSMKIVAIWHNSSTFLVHRAAAVIGTRARVLHSLIRLVDNQTGRPPPCMPSGISHALLIKVFAQGLIR